MTTKTENNQKGTQTTEKTFNKHGCSLYACLYTLFMQGQQKLEMSILLPGTGVIMWMLGIKPRSSGSSTNAFNH